MPAVPLKLKKRPRAVAAAVLEHEVPVEQNRLNLGEQRVVLVDVAPARLHHADVERRRSAASAASRKSARRHEIGVEDRDELAARDLEPGFERARLVARAIGPVEVA